jgi:hypothetical protein
LEEVECCDNIEIVRVFVKPFLELCKDNSKSDDDRLGAEIDSILENKIEQNNRKKKKSEHSRRETSNQEIYHQITPS